MLRMASTAMSISAAASRVGSMGRPGRWFSARETRAATLTVSRRTATEGSVFRAHSRAISRNQGWDDGGEVQLSVGRPGPSRLGLGRGDLDGGQVPDVLVGGLDAAHLLVAGMHRSVE